MYGAWVIIQLMNLQLLKNNNLTLICGIPNAGKTLYANRFPNVVRYDSLRLITPQRYAHICALAATENICVEGVYGEKWRREELVKACHEQGHTATCIWLDTPTDKCLERERNYRHRPESLVLAHAKMFEPPTLDEGWDEIIRITGEENG